MIAGTGIDIAEIKRVERLLRHKSITHVFGSLELQMLKGRAPASYAANFCAKEAFAKALGTGVRGFSLNQVEILRDGLGRPYYVLNGAAKEAADGLRFSLSLTHTREYAAAVAVAEYTAAAEE